MDKYLSLTQPVMEMARLGFGEALLQAGKDNTNVVALCADLTDSIKVNLFAKAFPNRYFEMGVAEQNMMGIAAGLALAGKIPFIASYAVFNPGRNWDQLRVSVCYSQANVKIIGAHAGLSVGPDGATHQALEDIAITRALPDLTVIVPTDITETRKVISAAVAHVGPVYIRFGRDTVPTVTLPDVPFEIGRAYVLEEGTDVTLLANGAQVYEALVAAKTLKERGIFAEVISVPTVKPLDHQTIVASLKKTGAAVTVEEAQIIGGLGSAIAELAGEHCPVPLKRIGMQDRFGESGTPAELFKAFGINAETIVESAQVVIKRKK